MPVYQAQWSDPDLDQLAWRLTGADAHLLTADQFGAVRLIAPADFETKTSYQ